jgi:nitroreductase
MDLYEAIHKRRSHRHYRPEMPPKEALERVIDAALWAPSGMNTQCWDLTVMAGKVRDEFISLINHSIEKLIPIMQQTGVTEKSQKRVVAFFKDLGGAPVVIAVTVWKWGDATGGANIQSGAALMQNLLLVGGGLTSFNRVLGQHLPGNMPLLAYICRSRGCPGLLTRSFYGLSIDR